MSVVDRERFILGLSKSGLLSSDDLKQWKSGLPSDGDSKSLARDLVSKGEITTWQAKMILKGVANLTIGNYLLTERVEKTELGDRFAAVHPQLSRNVSIQYLASELSQSADSKKKIFALGSKLSELDHPNLMHVYDVDEEGDRIYLVSELGNATPLPDYSPDNPTLSCPQIAKLTLGCVEGIEHAHAHGIVHGKISPASIFVKPNGDAKIGELTRFAVSNAIAENPAGPESDIAAIRKVAASLLRRVPEDAQSSEQFSKLKTSIASMISDHDAAMVSLRELADLYVVSSDVLDSDVALLVETELISADNSPTINVAGQTAAVETTPLQPRRRPQQKQPAPEVPENGSSLVDAAKRNPVALISAAVLAGLVLLGGSIFAATTIMSQPVEVSDAGAKDPTSNVSLLSDEPDVVTDRKAVTDPEANRKAIEAMFGSSDGGSASNTETAARDKKPERAKPKETDVAKSAVKPKVGQDEIDAIFAEEDAVKDAGEPMRPVEVASKESPAPEPEVDEPKTEVVADEEPATKTEPAEKNVASKPAADPKKPTKKPAKQQELKKGENPFTKFAAVVDLPGIDSTNQVSFGKLILEKRHLLGAEILSSPNAHRSKPIFTMARSSDDKQSWDIGYAPSKKKDPTTIAKLQKTADELKFNWLPEAQELPIAESLRNCRIKLSTPQDSHWLTLRKPIKIDGFKFAKDSGTAEVEVDIPNMPTPSSLSGTLFRMKLKADRKKGGRYTIEQPELVGSVARMNFTQDKDQFIFVDVTASLRKALKVDAVIVLQPDPNSRATPIKDPSKLKEQFTNPLRQMARQAAGQLGQAEQTLKQRVSKQPNNKKMSKKDQAKFLKPYQNAASVAAEKARLTDLYEQVVPQLAGQDIPIVITYKLNDQHRIVLAYTVTENGAK